LRGESTLEAEIARLKGETEGPVVETEILTFRQQWPVWYARLMNFYNYGARDPTGLPAQKYAFYYLQGCVHVCARNFEHVWIKAFLRIDFFK
jgi:hypothetical protein